MVVVQVYDGDGELVGTMTSDGKRVMVHPDTELLRAIAQEPIVGRASDGVLDPTVDPDKFLRCLHYAYKGSALRVSKPLTQNSDNQ